MRRYAIQGRDDYRKYNQLAGSLRQLAHKIAALDPADPFRRKHEDMLLEKMFAMGILGTGGKDSDVRTACETYTDFVHPRFRWRERQAF